MITNITQATLEKHLPFTADVKGSRIFTSYAQVLAEADRKLKLRLLDSILYDKLKAAFAAETLPENEALTDTDYRIGCTLEDLQDEIERYICNTASVTGAGKHDLVQTISGFGTVSGQQVAIASTARVQAMMLDCQTAANEAEDNILKMLIGNTYTQTEALSSNAWKNKTDNFIWTHEDMDKVMPVKGPGYMGAGGSDVAMAIMQTDPFLRYATALVQGRSIIDRIMSRAQRTSLINTMRSGSVSDAQQDAIDECRKILSAQMRADENTAMDIQLAKEELVSIMEDNKTVFDAYQNSEVKAARDMGAYQNDKNATGYWL